MPSKLSPHALTLITLVNNAADLCLRHHSYDLARDVILATKKIAFEFGFEIEDDIFRFILKAIGNKTPASMSRDFAHLTHTIVECDRKLNKEQLANGDR
jgi:hypothetical protein